MDGLFVHIVVLSAISVCMLTPVSGKTDAYNNGKYAEQQWSAPKNFSFASYYSDHMVLQRAPARAVIWGYSPNVGETITVKLSNRSSSYQTKVYEDPMYKYGVWKIKLPAESSPGPFTITAMSSKGTIELQDVMFGDVWLCSGQSNMVFTLIQAYNATEEVADADNYPNIRLLTTAEIFSSVPVPDVMGYWEKWSRASHSSVGGDPWKYFSAVCWLYGKALYKELGYPIGLIDTTWGGTIIEAWMSADALAQCGITQQSNKEDDILYFKNNNKRHDMPTKQHDLFGAGTARSSHDKNSILSISKKKPDYGFVNGPEDNSNLWNSMIYPFLNMTLYGVLWYQGESNEDHNTDKYNCTFPAMIDDFRIKFHNGSDGETDPMFPFGFVQIGPKDPNSTFLGYPEVRWHQTADYGYTPNPRMKKVFMAAAVDMSDFNCPWHTVHYRDKQDVAARLVLGGLTIAYGKPGLTYQGPLPSQIMEGSNYVALVYKDLLIFRNRIGFEALCPVPNITMTYWTDLPVLTTKPNTITLFSEVCGEGIALQGIRYLWRESPCPFKECTVYSAVNPLLPGPPFVTYRQMTGVAGTVHDLDMDSPVTIV